MPTKYLRPGPARIRGLRIYLDVETRQTRSSGQQKNESRDRSQLNYAGTQHRDRRPVATCESPTSTPGSRGTPKAMTSASESSSRPKALAVLVSRAIPPSKKSSTMATPIALAAMIEVPGIAGRALNGLRNRVIPCGHIAGREHRRQDVKASFRTSTIGQSNRRIALHAARGFIAPPPYRAGGAARNEAAPRPARWSRLSRDRQLALSFRHRQRRSHRCGSQT